jgi:hypothetical protein
MSHLFLSFFAHDEIGKRKDESDKIKFLGMMAQLATS